jgi:hypothetical protein
MDTGQNARMIQVNETEYKNLVRDYFSMREKVNTLQEELVRYRSPMDASKAPYVRGIKCYLLEVLLPYSTPKDIDILYDDICVYADDYPQEFNPSKYNPVWVSSVLRGYDLCRLFWGINKSIGYRGPIAGEFLKAVFPTFFSNTQASSLASNLTKYDEKMTIRNIEFGAYSPREYFTNLYKRRKNYKYEEDYI